MAITAGVIAGVIGWLVWGQTRQVSHVIDIPASTNTPPNCTIEQDPDTQQIFYHCPQG